MRVLVCWSQPHEQVRHPKEASADVGRLYACTFTLLHSDCPSFRSFEQDVSILVCSSHPHEQFDTQKKLPLMSVACVLARLRSYIAIVRLSGRLSRM